MDEKGVEAAGIKPLEPYLVKIDGWQSKPDLAEVVANPAYFMPYRCSTLFRFGSEQDAKNSAQVIAVTDQGGLGLPDRDYYVKDDAKSQELRKAYLAHVQKMLELLGDKPESTAAEAQTVMRIETALAQSSMTRVERRDPQKLYHKMTAAELEALAPSFPWQAYFARVGLTSLTDLNVASPNFFKALHPEIENKTLTSRKTDFRWHLGPANARCLHPAFGNAGFHFH